MAYRALFLWLCVAGCTSAPPSTGDADTDTDTDSDTDTDMDTDSDFDDPRGYVDDEHCDDFSPADVDPSLPEYDYVATAVWVGDFTFDAEGDISGTEELFWSPKPEWEADPDPDIAQQSCKVIYDVGGTVGDSDDCSACDYKVDGMAFRQDSLSTCPQDVLEDLVPETYDVIYHVRVGADGSSSVYFPSMTEMDTDYAMGSDVELVFATSPACWLH